MVGPFIIFDYMARVEIQIVLQSIETYIHMHVYRFFCSQFLDWIFLIYKYDTLSNSLPKCRHYTIQ
jgi:hypothetical protein